MKINFTFMNNAALKCPVRLKFTTGNREQQKMQTGNGFFCIVEYG